MILTTSPTFATIGATPGRLRGAGYELVRATDPGQGAYLRALPIADYLVAGLLPVTAETLAAGPNLRGVLKHGVGTDSIDIDAATSAGIPVTSTPGANSRAVAEMALGAIFALSRNVVAGHLSVISGGWERRRGREIAGTTLGILGFGRIGQRLARIAGGVGMRVVAHDPFPDTAAAEDLGVTLAPFADTLRQADFLSLHLAGGSATRHLIDAAALAAMKPGSALLNFARGSLVDLDALAAALRSGHLVGAAIDAYPVEPPDPGNPIFAAPNLLFSPHSGADTVQSIERMSDMVFEDIQAIAGNGMPPRALNAEALGARAEPRRSGNANPFER